MMTTGIAIDNEWTIIIKIVRKWMITNVNNEWGKAASYKKINKLIEKQLIIDIDLSNMKSWLRLA